MHISQQINKSKFVRRAEKRERKRALIVFSAVVLGFSFVTYLAKHPGLRDLMIPRCGFKQKYHLPCPTCSMTTATLQFVQGKIVRSFCTQPAAAFLCSLLVIAAFLAFIIAFFGVYFSFLDRFSAEIKIKHVALALLIIVAAGYAVTLTRSIAGNW